MGTGLFFRLAAVGAFVAAPLSLNSTSATPAIFSGDANASGGPGLGIENTGGNVQGGKGHSESKTVMGDPSAAPTLAPVVTPKVVQNPGADALARARAQVAAAKEINAVLKLLPRLVDGQWHDLGAAAKVLKDAGLLPKSAPATKLFRKHSHAFELQPEKQPNQVRFAT